MPVVFVISQAARLRSVRSYLTKSGYSVFDDRNHNLRFCMASTLSNSEMLASIKKIVPAMTAGHHKGQCGRIGIIGGCKEYTGAPYFAAISALKVGADLSHVFCTRDASTVIKSYSPELIVHPVLDDSAAIAEIKPWLPRLHTLVIGPGLGREDSIFNTVKEIIALAKQANITLVVDADGLFLVSLDPTIISGYKRVVLTPNKMEFQRLYEKVFSKVPSGKIIDETRLLASELGSVTIVTKGAVDVITNGEETVVCDTEGSFRRCGGQGDLLSGSLGTFSYWSTQYAADSSLVKAGYAACFLTRECNKLAFESHRRAMTTSDMIVCIGAVFNKHFE